MLSAIRSAHAIPAARSNEQITSASPWLATTVRRTPSVMGGMSPTPRLDIANENRDYDSQCYKTRHCDDGAGGAPQPEEEATRWRGTSKSEEA